MLSLIEQLSVARNWFFFRFHGNYRAPVHVITTSQILT